MKYRSICMLGGSGFVGGHLAARLASDGVDVKILTRNAERSKHLTVLPTVKLVQGDCHDPAVLEREFQGMDAVINLVGILNEKGHKGEGFRRAHVELTRKVLDACQQTGVRRLLHMSSLNADGGGPSHYLRTRGEAESLVHIYSRLGLQATIFQPSTIFGEGDSSINRFAGLLRLMPIFPLACPHSRMAPVHVGDVVEAFHRSLQDRNTIGRRYQLCGPDVMTLKEIVSYTARVMGKRRLIIGLPDFLSRLQANLMEFFPGKPFSRDNYHSLLVDSVCMENGLAELGITATAMDAVVPRFLGGRNSRDRFAEMRRQAKRGKES